MKHTTYISNKSTRLKALTNTFWSISLFCDFLVI